MKHAQYDTRWLDVWVGLNLRQWTISAGVIFDEGEASFGFGFGPIYFGFRVFA